MQKVKTICRKVSVVADGANEHGTNGITFLLAPSATTVYSSLDIMI